MHGNACSYSATAVKHFLVNCSVMEIIHSLYSPSLVLAVFFLFPKVETGFRGRRFQDIRDIKKNITAELNAIGSFGCF
jgi:hypothetical protein